MPDDEGRRDEGRREWVTRVLGVALPASAPSGPGVSRTGDIWRAAAAAVGEQLGVLAGALRQTGVPQLIDLSRAVEHLLEDISPAVADALQACDRTPSDAPARRAALAAIATASTWAGKDRRVLAVDGNLFGVTVTAGATLGAALRKVQTELEAAA